MLELTDLTKKYGDFTAVNHISLRVEKERYSVCWDQTAPVNQQRCR